MKKHYLYFTNKMDFQKNEIRETRTHDLEVQSFFLAMKSPQAWSPALTRSTLIFQPSTRSS
jgi:hypothetical protein